MTDRQAKKKWTDTYRWRLHRVVMGFHFCVISTGLRVRETVTCAVKAYNYKAIIPWVKTWCGTTTTATPYLLEISERRQVVTCPDCLCALRMRKRKKR